MTVHFALGSVMDEGVDVAKEEAESKEGEKERFYRLSSADSRFKYELSRVPGSEKLLLCLQCGTCTADCPVARFSDSYRPIRILRMAQLGMRERVLSSDEIWLCATCFACSERCHQGVEFANILRALRNMAVKEGIIPPGFREIASNVLKTGFSNEITKFQRRKREKLGLPPLPNSNPERIAKLAEIVGFFSLIGRGDNRSV